MPNIKRWLLSALIFGLVLFPSVGDVMATETLRPAFQADDCLSMSLVNNVTFPSYSRVDGGKYFVKTWRVRNDGSCAWPSGTRLVFTGGEQMGRAKGISVGALAPGEKINLSITLLAPTDGGIHRGTWQLRDDEGSAFGERLNVVVRVEAENDATATSAVTSTPESPTSETTPTATPAADCLNSRYLADVTIPDYSSQEAGQGFVKTWRVRNSGSCDWPNDTQLTFMRGQQLDAPAKVNVGALEAGETKEISVNMKAPAANGTHRGVWRLTTSDEAAFGTNLTVVIRVGADATPTPAAVPTPAPEVAATPSARCLGASYVADVSIPDYTAMEPGQGFAKTWRVRNSGSCDWPGDAQLVFSSGEAMGAPANVAVGALAVGASSDVSVNMAAPANAGTYKGVWSMAAGDGTPFGGKITVIIRVNAPAPAATAAPEAPAATPAPATPAPPVPVSVPRGGFELGGHIRTWEHIAEMHHAGMSWAKIQVHYGEGASEMINMAHANGFKIQLSALGPAGMVVEGDFHAKYSAWVAGLAASGADAIEVWNEPNIDREWQVGHIDPAAYTRLLCAAYGAIKNANPGTAVISAAPAPTGYFGGCGANGCDDLPFIQGMYNAGAANCMDYIGAHHNAGATSPSARSGHPADGGGGHHSWYFLPQTETYYWTFRGTRQLFYTEMGYASQEGVPTFSDQFWWGRETNNAEQAAWLSEAVNLSRSTGMVHCIIVWNIDFFRYGYDPQDGYAIIRPGGGCPACDSLRAVMVW